MTWGCGEKGKGHLDPPILHNIPSSKQGRVGVITLNGSLSLEKEKCFSLDTKKPSAERLMSPRLGHLRISPVG